MPSLLEKPNQNKKQVSCYSSEFTNKKKFMMQDFKYSQGTIMKFHCSNVCPVIHVGFVTVAIRFLFNIFSFCFRMPNLQKNPSGIEMMIALTNWWNNTKRNLWATQKLTLKLRKANGLAECVRKRERMSKTV